MFAGATWSRALALRSKAPVEALAVGGLATAVLALIGIYRRMPRKVQYAPGDFLLGRLRHTLKALFSFKLHDEMASLHKELGTTFAYHIAGVPFVATICPKNLEHVLKHNFDNYVKGHVFREPFADFLGDGIFNVDGRIWFDQRKISSRMFTKRIFEEHIWGVVQKNTGQVLEVLRRAEGTTIDIFDLMNRYTLDTIGEIGFSRDIGSLRDPSSPFLQSFDIVQSSLIKRFWTSQGFPIWKVFRIFGLFWEKEMALHLRALNEYSAEIVDALYAKGKGDGDASFVGHFMSEHAKRGSHEADQKDFRRLMRDMVLNFLIAGRDTTAQALTWTLFELSQNPEVMRKVRQELEAVCGDEKLSTEQLKKLCYTKAVLNEALRLHPSVPVDFKLALRDDTLPDGTVVPAGCILQYTIYSQGRCEELWGEDAATFRPERWLGRKAPSNYEYTVFNAGPRECLGRRLAELEMLALLATVLPRVELSLDARAEDVSYDIQLTLGCRGGLPLHVGRPADC